MSLYGSIFPCLKRQSDPLQGSEKSCLPLEDKLMVGGIALLAIGGLLIALQATGHIPNLNISHLPIGPQGINTFKYVLFSLLAASGACLFISGVTLRHAIKHRFDRIITSTASAASTATVNNVLTDNGISRFGRQIW